MSTWGADSLENDDALTWLTDFCGSPERHLLLDALTIIKESEGQHLSTLYCVIALAAAEVVAALKKAPSPGLPGNIKDCLINLKMTVDSNLIQLAAQSVDRIKTESALKDSWEGSKNTARWYDAIANLEERLRQ